MNGAKTLHAPSAVLSMKINSAADEDDNHQGGLAIAPAKPKLKRPPLFKVVLL